VRRLILVLAILILAGPALAGQNPYLRIYLDADPPNYLHEIYPMASEMFDVYVCLDCLDTEGGTRGTAFLLQKTFVGFKLSQTSLLGGLDFGDAEVDGWTIAAGSDCVYPDENGIVAVGVIQYLYLGVPGTLDLLPHPGTGREAIDCDFQSDFWCIAGNLGVGMPPNPGEPDCDCFPSWPTSAVCEPQGGENPTHPPTYWYDVTVGFPEPFVIYNFHVQVFDPNIGNYTNWVQPPGWTHPQEVQQIGDELWISWCGTGDEPLFGGFRFQFDNPNASEWAHWVVAGVCDPTGPIVASSHQHADEPDGYGYRVHAPLPGTPVEHTTWGTLKALYR